MSARETMNINCFFTGFDVDANKSSYALSTDVRYLTKCKLKKKRIRITFNEI